MTEDDRLLLNDLRANVKLLFQEFNNFENEKKDLERTLDELKKQIEELKQEKVELGRKQETLKLANSILAKNEENKAAKQHINKLVREIDKCIALLNK